MTASSIEHYLSELKARDIRVQAEDGKLRINAPRGVLTENIKQELGQRKNEIIQYLQSSNNGFKENEHTIKRVPRDVALPLSFDQQRMWFIHKLDPNSIAYNLQTSIIINAGADTVNRAWNDLLQRHEILRTVYTATDKGDLLQIIKDFSPSQLELTDLSGELHKNRRQKIIETTKQLVSLPFDLTSGPVWRARTILLDQNRICFILVIHHIASDGWSLSRLTAELKELCDAYNEDRQPRLPELPLQYADYAFWQRNYLHGEVFERQMEYWRKSLANMPAALDMPTDHSRPAKLSGKAGIDYALLPEDLTEGIRKLAQKNRSTVFITLLAVFKILLYRYSGQNDIVVGTPIAGRTHSEVEDIQGLFLNNLVLRTEISGGMTFGELLDIVRGTTYGAYANQDMPFERLVEEFHPERDVSRNPMFQVMFNSLITASNETETLQADLDELSSTVSGGAQVDLAMHVYENHEGIRLHLTYSADLYDGATIKRMLQHYLALIDSVIRDPECPVGRLNMLTDVERTQLLDEWNRTTVAYPQNTCLHHLFSEQVQRTPDAVALEYGDTQLSYRELDARSEQLAQYLVVHGVGPGVLVGVFMERSLEMVIALYGILKAGGAYVPLDPDYPNERIEFMIEDTQTGIILSQQASAAQIPVRNVSVVCLDSQWHEIKKAAHTKLPEISATDPAYVIFTSGSTGRPKGVMNAHRGIVNRILWMQDAFELDADDAVLQKTPYSFDVSVWEFFWPLMAGARLVVAEPGSHKDPQALLDTINKYSITTLHFVPSMLQAFLEHADISGATTVKRVLCSGEALSSELQQQFFKASKAELHNLYGPTEAAVDVTHWMCRRDVDDRNVPIGRAIANTRLYILDSNGQPVPAGVPGELYIGGVQVAMGYLNRDDLNAEKFVEDPFSTDPQSRLYRTGDRVRYRTDGNIEYLDRFDHQIKLRGFRVELGEIENALLDLADITAAVVIVHEKAGYQRLVAYVQTGAATPPSTAELRETLKQRLPDYMVPATFMWLQDWPLTASGKIDRNALPEPERTRARTRTESPVASGELEQALASIWSELLEVDDVRADDMFFDLGGHSLLALKAVTRFEHETGKRIDLADMLGKNLRELVAGVDNQEAIARAQTPMTTVGALREGDQFPLSYAQKRLWFLHELYPDVTAYNVDILISVECDQADIEAALYELTQRHAVLRTSYCSAESEPVQVIHEQQDPAFSVIDLSHTDKSDYAMKLASVGQQAVRQPFNLTTGPVWRALIVKKQAKHYDIVLVIHHIATDGWSMNVLKQELQQLCAAYAAGRSPQLDRVEFQYVDYALWHRSWLEDRMQPQLDYWKLQLSGIPSTIDLPTDRPRPAVYSYNGGYCLTAIKAPLLNDLRSIAHEQGVTLFMLLLAVFNVLLSRYARQEDVVVGIPTAGRNRVETENMVGLFVNTLVQRCHVSGDMPFDRLLQDVRDTMLAAFDHQDVPFEQIVEAVEPERDLSRNPVFQVMFNLLVAPKDAADTQFDIDEIMQSSDTGGAQVDLALHAYEQKQQLYLYFAYSTDLFDSDTINRMLSHYQNLLQSVIETPEQAVGHLYMIDADEQRLLMEKINDNASRKTLSETTPVPYQAMTQNTVLSGELELAMARIWSELLDIDDVQATDMFFDLGGHSLLALKVVSRFEQETGLRVNMADLVSRSLREQLAEYQPGQKTEARPVVSLGPYQDGDEFPLSYAQERLWFLHELYPNVTAYNIETLVTVDCEQQDIESALRALSERHAILRTRYGITDNGPVQIIHTSMMPEISVMDYSDLDADSFLSELKKAGRKAIQKPFDLTTGPVWRALLVRKEPRRYDVVLVLHHIATDGWSMNIVKDEFRQLCDAHAQEREAQLPELPVQYADYAVWHRQWLDEYAPSQLDYWMRQLDGIPSLIGLPTDRPRPAVYSYNGGNVMTSTSDGLVKKLRALAAKKGVTLFMLLLAAFKVLLSRYARHEDIVVGIPMSGRDRIETEKLVGMFVNTLVHRNQVTADETFDDLLTQVHDTTLDVFRHQDVPFEQIVETIQPERDLSRNPLFQVMFNLLMAPDDAETGQLDIDKVIESSDAGGAQVDLTLHAFEAKDRLYFAIAYSTDLFDGDTIRRMLDHYLNLLGSIIDAPEQPVALLPMIGAEERSQLLDEWNRKTSDYPVTDVLQQRYEQQAIDHPDAVAVECDGEQLSYQALNARANQIAHYLRQKGVEPGMCVGLFSERSLHLPVAILGILKAGGTYVPMDPAYPAQRLAFMLEDSETPVLLTQASLQDRLPDNSGDIDIICIDRDWPAIEKCSSDNPVNNNKPEDIAYIIYTSGSTGQPKGVMVTHANVVRLFAATQDWYQFNVDDIWTLFHSSAFDFSVWEIWGALLHGGRLVVVPYEISRSPEAFYDLLIASGVTVLNQTPSAFQQLVVVDEGRDLAALQQLRLVIFGGEALDPQMLKPWFDRHGDRKPQLVNMYGITETTVHVTYRPITIELAESGASVIGSVIPDLELYILDAQQQPAPVGVPGEMYVGGAGLARGYLRREQLTEERFIKHPFSDRAGARLYRTGDLARYLANGDIEYLGRIDDQVKLRGFRIELGEIESALLEHDAVNAALVMVREDNAGEQKLVAYVQSSLSVPPDNSEIREALKQRLPDYMVPATVMWLQEFPLTANGKIDRKALPEPERQLERDPEEIVTPTGELEQAMAQIWSELLELDDIQANDMFFDLGGHSLLSIKVVRRFEQETGMRINPASLVTQTLRQLIAGLELKESEQKKSA